MNLNLWDFARTYAEKPERRVIGLMSGTSVDGVDAVRVLLSGSGQQTRITVERFDVHPFSTYLRETVLAVSQGSGNALSLSMLNFELGRLFADAASAVADGLPIDLVASHGQTVSHSAPSATLQIGESSVIAQRLNVPVVSDFRVADVALGGQGAPLIPYADWCLLTDQTECRAIQNIGGIGNVTYLPPNADRDSVLGFDTGPGNMLIDIAAQEATDGKWQYDEDGSLAAQGEVNRTLLIQLHTSAELILRKSPPRSYGREEFGRLFYDAVRRKVRHLPMTDLVATLTKFTAETIGNAYREYLPQMPDTVIVGGGGARNPVLMTMVREELVPAKVTVHEDWGINGYAKEATAFAILANETLLGNPSNLPSVTGASRPALLGKLTFP